MACSLLPLHTPLSSSLALRTLFPRWPRVSLHLPSPPPRALPDIAAAAAASLRGALADAFLASRPTWRSAATSNLAIFVADSPVFLSGLSSSGFAAAYLLGTLTWRAFGPQGSLLVVVYFVWRFNVSFYMVQLSILIFPIVLKDQLHTFLVDARDDLSFANCTDLANIVVKTVETDRHTVFSLVYHVIELALILPVATAIVERAFSDMNIIKTDLQNKMNDEWMNHSMVCYIERDVFASIKDEKILERFQGMRSRKKQLSRTSSSSSYPTIDEEMVG